MATAFFSGNLANLLTATSMEGHWWILWRL